MLDQLCILAITENRLRFSRDLSPGEASHLRGYFGETFRDEVLLHHHEADGSLRYDYPRVQFKVLDREATLLGISEGGEVVQRLWALVDVARIRQEQLAILEANLSQRSEHLGEAPDVRRYRFLSPWLALNQENHRRYHQARTRVERQTLLSRILVGNCLALAKSFGHHVQGRLTADVAELRESTCRLKGVPLIAFHGSFSINFLLPARLGIGKSVSRGFGTVEPLEGLPC